MVARAEYDFDSDRQDEVSFKAGSLLNLAPKGLYINVRYCGFAVFFFDLAIYLQSSTCASQYFLVECFCHYSTGILL